MKRLPSLPLVATVLIVACASVQAAQAQDATYLDAQQIPLGTLLAPPPEDGSAQQRADLEAVLNVQRTRTPDEVTRAKADIDKSVFRFADVLGPTFNEANLPKTAALFKAASHDAGLVAKSGKLYFRRARPFIASSEVHPTVPAKAGDAYDSYPSGHATFGYMSAILLAQMVPEKRDALFARGREFGENRVVDGVHYPSDVEAGRIDGTLVAAALMDNPAFQKAFAEAKAEVRAALALN
ncbi:phosphatase PAP2 family protein [Paraburkholderia sp. 1N]|uniref:Acid phosphatase n=1 Tax=Paraburkholderia solitsugae TaxID=2675748 RepID=A0ABX2BST8_9BURK|nr:phosphatase PAP2 family protein [Paraburkholderia solitsugae]NPT43952.1 phosphatase PAP2 family protein [Paraburkholderia solitsugae]